MNSITYIHLPDSIQQYVSGYIETTLENENPYFCDAAIAHRFATDLLFQFRRQATNSSVGHLIGIIEAANRPGGGVPPLVLRNGPRDQLDSLLDPEKRTGFDYGSNPFDRQKTGFITEWFCWSMSLLLNHDAVIHPAEHGGKNRFHLISPTGSADAALRNLGASTGGGRFPQHNDATVYHEIKSPEELDKTLAMLGTDVGTVAEILKRPISAVYEQILCEKFVRVDMTVLGGVLNLSTKTHVGLPRDLVNHLRQNGMTEAEIAALTRMPVAHIAGPADGEISGFVGNICPPLIAGSDGEITGTCINLAPDRLIYVGRSETDRDIFSHFLEVARAAPVSEVLLLSGDYLFLPNAFFANNSNVTHGRSELTDSEYQIPIGDERFARRLHCRQYAANRNRDGAAPFLDRAELVPVG